MSVETLTTILWTTTGALLAALLTLCLGGLVVRPVLERRRFEQSLGNATSKPDHGQLTDPHQWRSSLERCDRSDLNDNVLDVVVPLLRDAILGDSKHVWAAETAARLSLSQLGTTVIRAADVTISDIDRPRLWRAAGALLPEQVFTQLSIGPMDASWSQSLVVQTASHVDPDVLKPTIERLLLAREDAHRLVAVQLCAYLSDEDARPHLDIGATDTNLTVSLAANSRLPQ